MQINSSHTKYLFFILHKKNLSIQVCLCKKLSWPIFPNPNIAELENEQIKQKQLTSSAIPSTETGFFL